MLNRAQRLTTLTNNTDLNLIASSADNNATLNRLLASLLTCKTPPSLDPIVNLLVEGSARHGHGPRHPA